MTLEALPLNSAYTLFLSGSFAFLPRHRLEIPFAKSPAENHLNADGTDGRTRSHERTLNRDRRRYTVLRYARVGYRMTFGRSRGSGQQTRVSETFKCHADSPRRRTAWSCRPRTTWPRRSHRRRTVRSSPCTCGASTASNVFRRNRDRAAIPTRSPFGRCAKRTFLYINVNV